jgi:hypothetical protein
MGSDKGSEFASRFQAQLTLVELENCIGVVRLGVYLSVVDHFCKSRVAVSAVLTLPDTPFLLFFSFFSRRASGAFSIDDTSMTSFPKGPCSLGDSCIVPQHELRKNCPGCQDE